MITYTIRRLLVAIPVMLGITVLLFILVNITPNGGPLAAYVGPGHHITPQQFAAIKHRFGLDQPLPVRYFLWLKAIVHGDFGNSTQTGQPVNVELAHRLPPTIMLIGTSYILQELIALPLGMFSALRRYSLFDQIFTVLSYIGLSLPTFWFGLMMIMAFGVFFPIFPFSGMVNLRVSPPWGTSAYNAYFAAHPIAAILDIARHMALPVIVLATVGIAVDSRFMRASMLDIINMDYIRTARAKGLPNRVVIFKHALRNAVLPIVTNIGLYLPSLLGGAIVTEQIFSWPGMGAFFVAAASSSDFPVVLAYTTILAAATIIANLLTDLSYAFIDPRIQYS
jgi:peptide/nickel transport system permease protein